jgi:hypothetical protein
MKACGKEEARPLLRTVSPNAGANAAAIAALAVAAAKYPANDFNAGDSAPGRLLNTAGFRFNAPITEYRNSHIARLDFNLTDKHQVFGRANYIHDNLGNVCPSLALTSCVLTRMRSPARRAPPSSAAATRNSRPMAACPVPPSRNERWRW